MADVSILTRFEVSLSEQVVKDILNPEKTFESEIWKQNEGENVQAGSSIMLQKLGNSMMKLFVTVYQPSAISVAAKNPQNDGSMQTEEKETDKAITQTDSAVVENSSMQTEAKPGTGQDTQTESAECTGQDTQTDKVNTDSSEMQTEKAVLNDSFMQTDIKQFVDSSMQTDYEVCESEMQTDIMCFERFEQICQASVDTSDLGVQMQAEMYDQDMQTDLELVDSECQTEKNECSQDTQTEIKEFSDTDIQTEMSMALRSDGECQAVVEQLDGDCQAVVDMSDGDCQAVVDLAENECQAVVESNESECQAVVECSENECQAEVEQNEFECQVGAEVTENECQVEVESAEFECQMNPEISEIDIQTDQSLSLMMEGACQTDVSSLDSRSVCLQTEGTSIKTRTVQTESAEELEAAQTDSEQTVPQHVIAQPEAGEIPQQAHQAGLGDGFEHVQQIAPAEGMEHISIINNPDGSQQVVGEPPVLEGDPNNPEIPTIVSIEPVGKKLKTEDPLNQGSKADPIEVEKAVEDSSCQTDPVTIIIGDASFLVQRLKSSSVNPAKVEGNEIEIEVGPESDKKNIFSPDPYHDIDEKPYKKRGGPFGTPRGNRLPRTPKVKKERSVKKEKVSLPSIDDLLPTAAGQSRPVTKLPPPGSDEIGKFSCPFCAMTFHESPALYEHLQVDHSNITSATAMKALKRPTKVKPRRRPVQLPPELEAHDDMIERVTELNHEGEEPPILTPYEEGEAYQAEAELPPEVSGDGLPSKSKFPDDVYSDMPPGDDEGPGLFEDIPEPKPQKPKKERKYGRPVKGVKPYKSESNSNLEFDCPMCYEKFGTADILFLHIKRTHREEEEKRQRRDVVTALMHDTMSAVGKRKMPLPVVETDTSKPVKRRRTKEVLEEFEETLVEEAYPDDLVESIDQQERLREVEEEDEGELPPPDFEINTEPPQLEGEEEAVTEDMLEEMVEVVVHEPGAAGAQYAEQAEVSEEVAQEAYEEEEPEPQYEHEEPQQEVDPEDIYAPEAIDPEPIPEPPKKRGRPKKIPKDSTMQHGKGEDEEGSSPSTSGLRRTRHSLKGQGPPRPSPRTRGGRSGRP